MSINFCGIGRRKPCCADHVFHWRLQADRFRDEDAVHEQRFRALETNSSCVIRLPENSSGQSLSVLPSKSRKDALQFSDRLELQSLGRHSHGERVERRSRNCKQYAVHDGTFPAFAHSSTRQHELLSLGSRPKQARVLFAS